MRSASEIGNVTWSLSSEEYEANQGGDCVNMFTPKPTIKTPLVIVHTTVRRLTSASFQLVRSNESP
jgi:hypothetical protein